MVKIPKVSLINGLILCTIGLLGYHGIKQYKAQKTQKKLYRHLEKSRIPIVDATKDVYGLIPGDFNGDGKKDFVYTNKGGLHVLVNQEKSYQRYTIISGNNFSSGHYPFESQHTVTDMNNDGCDDVVLYHHQHIYTIHGGKKMGNPFPSAPLVPK